MRQNWAQWAIPVAALAVGLSVGIATGAGIAIATSDPTSSAEYRDLASQLDASRDQTQVAVTRAETAEASAAQAEQEAAARAAELDQREAAVAQREQAVTTTEQQIAARSVAQGTWTVGVDIEPGTYRTAEAVTGDCYWEITRAGTNGGDIIENDIVDGGFPTVVLSEGQVFTNNRCGTFVKQ